MTMLKAGSRLQDVLHTFPVTLPALKESDVPAADKNGVIPKGSTLQLERAESATPASTINVDSILGHSQGTSLNHTAGTAIA